jgi:long-chain acyl-CoA synthetase
LKKGEATPWADKLVFNQIKQALGGKVRLIYNGAASLPYHINEFISTVFGTIIGEGYGLTETSGTTCCSMCVVVCVVVFVTEKI